MKSSPPRPIFGILSGNGSHASAVFYKKLIDRASSKYGAINDDDFPRIILLNYPLAGISHRGAKDINSVGKELVNVLNLFKAVQPTHLITHCNSLNFPQNSLITLNMVQLLSGELKKLKPKSRVFILSSESSRKMFEEAVVAAGCLVEGITHKQQTRVNNAILKVMGGKRVRLNSLFAEVTGDIVIVGCTELSAIKYPPTRTIDTTELLIEKILEIHNNYADSKS